jgi:sigma-B regulation protein RsbU (phosphoserine phosphatase)
MQPSTIRVSDGFFRQELRTRRHHLLRATRQSGSDRRLQTLLAEVDAALDRLDAGSFGICGRCLEPIETDRLVRDPLARLCSDHPGETEVARVSQDLALARVVQRRLLPPTRTVIDGWTLHYRYAAAGEVGGDYVDVIDVPARAETLVLLGDVSGKGVAASMLASYLHATFRSLAPIATCTGDLLSRANDLFFDTSPPASFATLLVVTLGRDRALRLYNAGHWPPLVRRGTKVEAVPLEGTVPLGMFPAVQYAPAPLFLDEGDTLLLYTDGASEARDTEGREFGSNGLAGAMALAPSSSPFDIVERCFAALQEFGAGPGTGDDVTLLALSAGPQGVSA